MSQNPIKVSKQPKFSDTFGPQNHLLHHQKHYKQPICLIHNRNPNFTEEKKPPQFPPLNTQIWQFHPNFTYKTRQLQTPELKTTNNPDTTNPRTSNPQKNRPEFPKSNTSHRSSDTKTPTTNAKNNENPDRARNPRKQNRRRKSKNEEKEKWVRTQVRKQAIWRGEERANRIGPS